MSSIQSEKNKKEKNIKLIAFHLPQFHVCEENNEWWGEGFTEWSNTKKANKLFKNHNQPREPKGDNYYDLSNLEANLQQMRLAEEYGVYGFCYYHYWFKGKLLLNKPIELIRDFKGKKLPYCLCWANESWTRTWEGSKTVLLKQEYGSIEDWENHFQYLLTFFKDPFYIKQKNAPVLVLYRAKNIPDCDLMIEYWNRRCQEEGFRGTYIVEELNCFQNCPVCKNSNAFLEFEPLYAMTYGAKAFDKFLYKIFSFCFNLKNKTHNQLYFYNRLWKNILKRNHLQIDQKVCYLGAFVDWDNTARKGKYGRIVLGTTPEKFGHYMNKQYQNAIYMKCEYIFINAWNEWGEGTYLEPDKKNGYVYLEEIQKLVSDENGVKFENIGER